MDRTIPTDTLAGLENSAMAYLFFIGLALLAIGAALGIGAYAAYRRIPVRGKATALGKASVLGLAGLSIITLLAGLLSLVMFFLTPLLVKGLASG